MVMQKPYPKEVWLNGQWLPHDQATVSVFDRGFMLGDGVYEVIPCYNNRPFTLQEHLQRLQSGLRETAIAFDALSLQDHVAEAIDNAALPDGDGAVYMQITRGAAPRAHRFPAQSTPTVLIYAFPLTMKGFRLRMATTVISEDIRWHRCDIKSISLIANVRANEDAHSQGADENIFHRNGLMTEGSHTSLFLVRDGVVYTHPETPLILPGITRRVVIDLCHELEIPVREKAVPVKELAQMDEVFLTGTTAQVLAVGTIRNGMAACTPGDQAGPVTRRIQDAFLRRIQEQTGRSLL